MAARCLRFSSSAVQRLNALEETLFKRAWTWWERNLSACSQRLCNQADCLEESVCFENARSNFKPRIRFQIHAIHCAWWELVVDPKGSSPATCSWETRLFLRNVCRSSVPERRPKSYSFRHHRTIHLPIASGEFILRSQAIHRLLPFVRTPLYGSSIRLFDSPFQFTCSAHLFDPSDLTLRSIYSAHLSGPPVQHICSSNRITVLGQKAACCSRSISSSSANQNVRREEPVRASFQTGPLQIVPSEASSSAQGEPVWWVFCHFHPVRWSLSACLIGIFLADCQGCPFWLDIHWVLFDVLYIATCSTVHLLNCLMVTTN